MTITLKKYKKEFDHTYTFGVFPTLELLHHQSDHVHLILIHSRGERNEGVTKIQDIAAKRRIRVEVNDTAIERISDRAALDDVGEIENRKRDHARSVARNLGFANEGSGRNHPTRPIIVAPR